MKRLRYALICFLDRFDHYVLNHRWYGLCTFIAANSWWGDITDEPECEMCEERLKYMVMDD